MVLTGRKKCLMVNKVRTKFILSDLDYAMSKWSQNYLRCRQKEQLDKLASLTIKLIRLDEMLLSNDQVTHYRHNTRRRKRTGWR